MSLTREEIFAAWVPDLPEDEFGMPWTSWAKPVLFANLAASGTVPAEVSSATGGQVGAEAPSWHRERCAVVIDLPGPESVSRGLQFAELGFRPVPLFNGCPGAGELVPTADTCGALQAFATRLRTLSIHRDAPPVFLLDARRMTVAVPARPGLFDNRWLVFPQDFPSAHLLLARRIERAVLIQAAPGQPQNDLAHVLCRWQEAGLRIAVSPGRDGAALADLEVQKPSQFRSLWYRLRATLGLFPNSAGGFGAVIPQPSSG